VKARLTGIIGVMFLLVFGAGVAASAAPEQGPLSNYKSSSTRLVLLGTGGGPIPRVNRSQSASLIQVGQSSYLVDAGDGVVRQLVAAGEAPADINFVFLTHLHFDHVGGLPALIGFRWNNKPAGNLSIYGPPGTAAMTAGALNFLAIPEILYAVTTPPGPTLAQMVNANEKSLTGPTVIYQDANVKVTAVTNSHYVNIAESERPYHTQSWALRFDTPDRSIVFTGDTGPSASVVELAKGADILVSEVIDLEQTIAWIQRKYNRLDSSTAPLVEHMRKEHLTAEEVGKLAKAANVKMVVLDHLGMAPDSESDLRHFSDRVRKEYDGVVVTGKDFEEF